MLVCLYVDDMIYAGSTKAIVDESKYQMINEFEMIDLGSFWYFIGLEVKQEADGIFLL